MKKKYDQLNRKFTIQSKLFNFWISVAEAANRKAGMANMKCRMLSEEMSDVSDEILNRSKEASKMSK